MELALSWYSSYKCYLSFVISLSSINVKEAAHFIFSLAEKMEILNITRETRPLIEQDPMGFISVRTEITFKLKAHMERALPLDQKKKKGMELI